MKIYDCFLFNDENDILEIRLNELDKYVDFFIIVESEFTHQKKRKGKLIDEKILQKFQKKTRYTLIDYYAENMSPWEYENFQRNKISDLLYDCHDNDIIMVSDLDEIPKLDNFNFSKVNDEVVVFNQIMTMYKLNNVRSDNWHGTKLCKKKILKNPQWLRNLKLNKKYPFYRIDKFFKKNYINNYRIHKEGGWHFSWLKNAEQIINKVNSFAHTEINTDKNNDLEYIEKCILEKKCFFKDEPTFYLINTNKLPEYIKKNMDKYQKWISD